MQQRDWCEIRLGRGGEALSCRALWDLLINDLYFCPQINGKPPRGTKDFLKHHLAMQKTGWKQGKLGGRQGIKETSTNILWERMEALTTVGHGKWRGMEKGKIYCRV